MREQAARICKPVSNFREEHKKDQQTVKDIVESGPTHARSILVIFGHNNFDRNELVPTRNLEFELIDTQMASIILEALFLQLLYALLVVRYWDWSTKKDAARPFLAQLPVKMVMRLLAWGVLLPLLLYAVHSRYVNIDWREHSLFSATPYFPTDLVVLAFVLLILPVHLVKHAIYRYCTALGMPVPPRARGFRHWAWVGLRMLLFLAIGIVGTTAAVAVIFFDEQFVPYRTPTIIALLFFCSTLPLGNVLTLVQMKWRNRYGQYYGTVAKTLIPIYVFTLFLISVLALPCLAMQEAHWLHRDRLVILGSAPRSFPVRSNFGA